MNRRLALWTVLLTTMAGSPLAFAQQGQGEVTIGYQGLPYKATGESRTGIQLSESVLMHVGAGAEAGYDSNVFYQDAALALEDSRSADTLQGPHAASIEKVT